MAQNASERAEGPDSSPLHEPRTLYGSDLPELLCNAAAGMNSLLAPQCDASIDEQIKPVALEAIDAESLLVEWLSELAYWAESEMLVFHRFGV